MLNVYQSKLWSGGPPIVDHIVVGNAGRFSHSPYDHSRSGHLSRDESQNSHFTLRWRDLQEGCIFSRYCTYVIRMVLYDCRSPSVIFAIGTMVKLLLLGFCRVTSFSFYQKERGTEWGGLIGWNINHPPFLHSLEQPRNHYSCFGLLWISQWIWEVDEKWTITTQRHRHTMKERVVQAFTTV